MATTMHPHTDMPTRDELARLIDAKFPAQRDLYLEAHRLILDTVPGIRYSVDCTDAAIGYGARQFGYDGWGMAALTPYAGWVSLGLLKGTRLHDPAELLEGTGALVRHVKLRSAEELEARREALRALIVDAAGLDGE